MQLHRLECSSMSQVLNTICQGQKKPALSVLDVIENSLVLNITHFIKKD